MDWMWKVKLGEVVKLEDKGPFIGKGKEEGSFTSIVNGFCWGRFDFQVLAC